MKVTVNTNKNSKNRQIESILDYCQSIGIPLVDASCGGKGTCKKCLVRVLEPYQATVLACNTPVSDGMVLEVSEVDKMHVLGVDTPSRAIKDRNTADTVVPDRALGTVAACDIGTTTVVCSLVDGHTGRVLASRSGVNRQRCFGADVISRIEAASVQNLARMKNQIVGQINTYIVEMLSECGREEVELLAVAGNTVMCHLLLGLSPHTLGKAPYTPQEWFGAAYNPADYGIKKCKMMIIFPAISGFVGGDVVSGMAEAVDEERLTLYLDVGTNGEMALGKDNRYLCCATAAGPAFEGAQIELGMGAESGAIDRVWLDEGRICYSVIGDVKPIGFCGSGLIDALYVLKKAEIIDTNGTIRQEKELQQEYKGIVSMVEDVTSDRLDAKQLAVFISPETYITQEDIRRLQLAKAAIAAGIDVLFSVYSCEAEEIDELVIAGGFGNYIDKTSAAGIGLFPEVLLGRTVSVGNAAGKGAVLAAVSKKAWERALHFPERLSYIELASYSGFDDIYMSHINL